MVALRAIKPGGMKSVEATLNDTVERGKQIS